MTIKLILNTILYGLEVLQSDIILFGQKLHILCLDNPNSSSQFLPLYLTVNHFIAILQLYTSKLPAAKGLRRDLADSWEGW